jgi:concentrative nucleoside transporter, CNT family
LLRSIDPRASSFVYEFLAVAKAARLTLSKRAVTLVAGIQLGVVCAMLALQSAFGFIAFFAIAYLMSENRLNIAWKTVGFAIFLQALIGITFYKFPYFQPFVLALNDGLTAIQTATVAGSQVLFGYLGGGELPFEVKPGANALVLATQVLPIIIVISALASLLHYLKVLPLIVRAFSYVLTRTLGIGGALGLSTAANVFLGPVESPLFIKPYLARVSRGELFAIMVGGMSGIAGTMMVIYGSVLQGSINGALGHILIASFMSAPATIAIAALMVPHQGDVTSGEVDDSERASSAMDAITRGTVEGMSMLINIVAMVLVLTALIALLNIILKAVGFSFTLQSALGVLMAPLAWLVGVPAAEVQAAGSLLGTKTVLNEFLAYMDLVGKPDALGERSKVLMTYALCGFANFGSLGIMIGGLGTLCPERRSEVIALGYRCLIGGTLATLSGAALIGVVY